MVKKENIKLGLLEHIKKGREVWSAPGDKASMAEERLRRFESAEAHIDEATRVYIIAKCRNFAELYTRNPSASVKEMAMWSCVVDLRLSEEDLRAFQLSRYEVKDDLAQRIYEQFGFEDKVPTDSEISKLESQEKQEGLSEVEKWKLRKQIRLMQIRRGENCIDGDLPYVFEDDVIERYDKLIMEASERESRYGEVSKSDFSNIYKENKGRIGEAFLNIKSNIVFEKTTTRENKEDESRD